MSRPLRIEYPGAHYHVMNRGNARNNIFLIDDDYGMFLALLEESSKLFGAMILSYCLMTNHYHLLVHTGLRFSMKELSPSTASAVDMSSFR